MPNARVKPGETAEEARLRYNRESREYRQKRKESGNPVKGGPSNLGLTPEQNRKKRLRKSYGLTPEQAQALYDSQGGDCKICGAALTLTGGKRFKDAACIDHNHTTGVVRGILCSHCNTGLGMFRDSPELLARAIQYLS